MDARLVRGSRSKVRELTSVQQIAGPPRHEIHLRGKLPFPVCVISCSTGRVWWTGGMRAWGICFAVAAHSVGVLEQTEWRGVLFFSFTGFTRHCSNAQTGWSPSVHGREQTAHQYFTTLTFCYHGTHIGKHTHTFYLCSQNTQTRVMCFLRSCGTEDEKLSLE